jgi:hypothetical protein
MAMICHKCGAAVELEVVGRRDECQRCGADLHVCLNCGLYASNRANECFEPQAERVKEKDRSNFCDFFQFRKQGKAASGKEDAKKLWDELFKKSAK